MTKFENRTMRERIAIPHLSRRIGGLYTRQRIADSISSPGRQSSISHVTDVRCDHFDYRAYATNFSILYSDAVSVGADFYGIAISSRLTPDN